MSAYQGPTEQDYAAAKFLGIPSSLSTAYRRYTMSLARAVARRPLAVIAFATATVTVVALGTGSAAQAAPAKAVSTATGGLYILQMVGDPLASYTGNVAGYVSDVFFQSR